jgi:hypothetical protein
MRGVILPRRDGEFRWKYDSRLCKRFVNDVGDVRVPVIILLTVYKYKIKSVKKRKGPVA